MLIVSLCVIFNSVSIVVGLAQACNIDMPSVETLVGWLLEHQDSSSDSDSISDDDDLNDQESVSLEDFDDFDGGLFPETEVRNSILICANYQLYTPPVQWPSAICAF